MSCGDYNACAIHNTSFPHGSTCPMCLVGAPPSALTPTYGYNLCAIHNVQYPRGAKCPPCVKATQESTKKPTEHFSLSKTLQRTWDTPLSEADEYTLLSWLQVLLYDKISNKGQPELQEALDHTVRALQVLYENDK